MKKFLYLFVCVAIGLAFSACKTQMVNYNIDGSSNISGLESETMYLQTFDNSKMTDIDSAKVIHGQFEFSNSIENASMAFLQMEQLMLPIVIEEGNIKVSINKTGTVMGGTELNERLYQFIKVRDSLMFRGSELEREYLRAWMDDENMSEMVDKLGQQQKLINENLDLLITNSITDNFENVLGPGIFMISTLNVHPEMYPWITSIMTKAPESFKNDPYVKMYIKAVHEEMEGSDTPIPAATPAPASEPAQTTDNGEQTQQPAAKEVSRDEEETKETETPQEE